MHDQRQWYEVAFERGYLDVYPHHDLFAARAEVAGLLERGVGGQDGRAAYAWQTLLDSESLS